MTDHPDEPAGVDLQRRLVAEHGATSALISALEGDLRALIAASADANADDEHDPEGTTIAFERAQLAATIGQARDRLVELDEAVRRVREGSYRRCQHCDGPIAAQRLLARPATRYCVSCATELARRGRR